MIQTAISILALIGFVLLCAAIVISIIPRKPRQTCFIFCPACDHELIKTASRLNMSYLESEGVGVYDCPRCGERSAWDFITYPVPVLIESSGC
jgi:hypothetical protein